jgi:hypothetical protein
MVQPANRSGVFGALGDVFRVMGARPMAVSVLGLVLAAIPNALTAVSERWYLALGYVDTRLLHFAFIAYQGVTHSPFIALAIIGAIVIATPILQPDAPRLTIGAASRRYALPVTLLQLIFGGLALLHSVLLQAVPNIANLVTGVVITAIFFVCVPSLMFENLGVLTSLARSGILTSTKILKVIAVVALLSLPAWFVAYGPLVHYPHWARTMSLQYAFVAMRSAVFGMLEMPMWLAIPAVYFRLRRPNAGTATADVFN